MNIRVFDLFGKLLIEEQNETSSTQLNIDSICAGTYLLELTNSAGEVVKKKFVKQ
jgi:hypothetical protein